MELLKEVAKDRLVVMVTHNPELAEEYSTRIVKVLDGHVIDDNDPFDGETKKESSQRTKKKSKKTNMNFLTALSYLKISLMLLRNSCLFFCFSF